MNWKKEAIARLRQYDSVRNGAESLTAEVARIRAALEGPGAARMEGGGGSTKTREDWMLDQMVLLEELEQRLEQTNAWLQATDRALSTLTAEEKLVLHRMFICPQRGAADRLCRELNTERSSVYRKRERTLNRFTTALYGPT